MAEKIINKIGAVIIKDKKILVGKKKGKFILPGGKIKLGESDEDCLRRELMEEFGVGLVSFKYLETFEDDAALDPGMKVRIKAYLTEINKEPLASGEIEKAEFVESKTNVKLGSILSKFLIPRLVELKLIN